MPNPLDDATLDRLFRRARTHNVWLDRPVEEATLRRLWDLAKMAPTSANCSPARVVFVRSPEGKRRLEPALDEGNRAKTMAAPVTAIVATDHRFYDKMPYLFPHTDARAWFAGKPHADTAAFRNGTLQGAYLILAARALGLDCGPMSGFDPAKVDAAFFPREPHVRSNFLINLGYGDPAALFPRSPRLSFEEACRIE
jgi:3-hydroxypropanoate dehydrogenase